MFSISKLKDTKGYLKKYKWKNKKISFILECFPQSLIQNLLHYSLPTSTDAIPCSSYSGKNLGIILVTSLSPYPILIWQEITPALSSKYNWNPISSHHLHC